MTVIKRRVGSFVLSGCGGGGGGGNKDSLNPPSWKVIGIPGFSRGKTEFTKIAIDGNGVPYVAYSNKNDGDKVTVMKYSR